jgi:hypothetical protein
VVGAGAGALGGTAIGAALDASDRRERNLDRDYDPHYYIDPDYHERYLGHRHRHHHDDSDEDEEEDEDER